MPPDGLLPLLLPPPPGGFDPRGLPEDGETEPLIPERGPPLDGLDPAPAALLVEAGLFADPPLIAPAGGKDGRPLGPLS